MHGSFFEDAANDPWYTHKVFRDAQARDPNVKLFFNEFSVVSAGRTTVVIIIFIKSIIIKNSKSLQLPPSLFPDVHVSIDPIYK